MKEEKFVEFWDKYSRQWLESKINVENETLSIKDICLVRRKYGKKVHAMYENIKLVTKESYFQNPNVNKISRYKRAAAITYAVCKLDPVMEDYNEKEIDFDKLFLKQRLAFFMGIASIIMDYNKEDVKQYERIFYFEKLNKSADKTIEDDFLTSMYKDLYFSEIYYNYNILTMAKVFGLITEHASELKNLTPIEG